MNSISSNHLKLLKLLTSVEDRDFYFSNFFLKSANIKLYIKEIYNFIFPNKKSTLITMIYQILNHKNLFLELKESQVLLKNERKFFIILELLIKDTLNLEDIAKKLSLTRRTLNYDLVEIKEELLTFNLVLKSQIGKGIFLNGHWLDKKKASFHFFYKFFIEENFLPNIFKNHFNNFFFNENNHSILKNDIDILLKQTYNNCFLNAKELLLSFYLSFVNLNYDITKFPDFQFYFYEIFSIKEDEVFYNTFKNSIFRHVNHDGMIFLVNLLKILTGKISPSTFPKKNYTLIWDQFFLKHFNKIPNYSNEKYLNSLILRINFIDKYFPIYSFEFSFLNFNIENNSLKKSIKLYSHLKKYYKNISFADAITLFLFMETFENQKKEVIIVYKYLPIYILENLKEKLETKYNIKINYIIDIDNFINSNIEIINMTIATLCDIDLSSYNFEILKLKI